MMAVGPERRVAKTFLVLSLLFAVVPAARAADVSAEEIRAAFCKYFDTGDVEAAFRPIPTLGSARISTSSKVRNSKSGNTTSFTTELKGTHGWTARYHYQQKADGGTFGYTLKVRTSKAEEGLIFNSLAQAKQWLGQYGSVRYDSDLEGYTVDLKMHPGRGKDNFPLVSLTIEFDQSNQSIAVEWLDDDDESAAGAICR